MISARRFVVGVDLGQQSDPTAIVAVEAIGTRLWPDPVMRRQFHVRMIEQPELGTPYKAIVDRLVTIMRAKDLCPPGYAPPCLVVDQTGVGRPVVDYLRSAGLDPVGISISGGQTVNRPEPSRYPQDLTVPKADLVAVVQMALGNELLKVAKLPLAATLKAELKNFKLKYSKAGNEQYEAWRSGDHDDIVLALAIALWTAEHGQTYSVGQPKSAAKPVIKLYGGK